MKIFSLIFALLTLALSARAWDETVIYQGKITSLEPEVIRMNSGTTELEIPRKYSTEHYLVGDHAQIEVPDEAQAEVKFHPRMK